MVNNNKNKWCNLKYYYFDIKPYYKISYFTFLINEYKNEIGKKISKERSEELSKKLNKELTNFFNRKSSLNKDINNLYFNKDLWEEFNKIIDNYPNNKIIHEHIRSR